MITHSLFREKCIKDFIVESPSNHLPAFDNDPIFDEPLVGFADGDDPIFSDYKAMIGDYLGCGLCQTKVSCEDKIPPNTPDKNGD